MSGEVGTVGRRGRDGGGTVQVGVRVVELGTTSRTIGTAEVADREVYMDGAR